MDAAALSVPGQALLAALATPAPGGRAGIPVLLWGRPGVGKSSFIESLGAAGDWTVTTLIASIHDPTDFSGLPILQGERVRYAAPRWVDDFSADRPGILFLDELSTAPPSVQSALLRVVFERRVGFHPLPDTVRIVAAANPPDLTVGGWELSPPLRNRFVHLDWAVDAEQYVAALATGWPAGRVPQLDARAHALAAADWRVRIAGYLRVNPAGLHASPEDNPYGFASPRSWDFAAALLASCELLGYRATGQDSSLVPYRLAVGCLGEATAITFFEYVRNLRLPDPAAVLAGTATVDLPALDDAELYVLFGSLNGRLLRITDGAELLAATDRYLELMLGAFGGERRDIAFVPLKELARSGLLARVAAGGAPGADPAVRARTLARLGELFSDPDLTEFTDALA